MQIWMSTSALLISKNFLWSLLQDCSILFSFPLGSIGGTKVPVGSRKFALSPACFALFLDSHLDIWICLVPTDSLHISSLRLNHVTVKITLKVAFKFKFCASRFMRVWRRHSWEMPRFIWLNPSFIIWLKRWAENFYVCKRREIMNISVISTNCCNGAVIPSGGSRWNRAWFWPWVI